MKKVWKWVIGVVIVLVVVAALVGGAFLMRSHFANVVSVAKSTQPGLRVPGFDDGQRGPGRYPGMMPFGGGGWGDGYGRHMRGFGMMGFGRRSLFGGLIGGLFCLGFLALIGLGIYWLVRRLRKPAVASAPVATVAAPVAAETKPVASDAMVADVHPCSKCGEPVQNSWKHCPNCGKRQ
jgi:hypothetical protein